MKQKKIRFEKGCSYCKYNYPISCSKIDVFYCWYSDYRILRIIDKMFVKGRFNKSLIEDYLY